MPFADLHDGAIFYERRGTGPAVFLLPPVSRGPEGLDQVPRPRCVSQLHGNGLDGRNARTSRGAISLNMSCVTALRSGRNEHVKLP